MQDKIYAVELRKLMDLDSIQRLHHYKMRIKCLMHDFPHKHCSGNVNKYNVDGEDCILCSKLIDQRQALMIE